MPRYLTPQAVPEYRYNLSNLSANEDVPMASLDEQILRTVKEIVVKFIETGRLSPTGFHETFREIYSTVATTVKGEREVIPAAEKKPPKKKTK